MTQQTAGAFHSLLHESLHRQGFDDERTTEAYAIVTIKAAGQMIEYGRRLDHGAPPGMDTWDLSEEAGKRAMRLAWLQSATLIASTYQTEWDNLPTDSWADALRAGIR